MTDYYKTLGVGRDASKADIKKAFHKLAGKHHPDRNPNATEKEKARFKEINAAYAVLSDDKKRSDYDRFGTDSPGASSGFGGFEHPFGGGAGGASFADIFNDFFGGSHASTTRGSQRGSDLQLSIGITLKEAFTGVTKEIDFERVGKCDDCSGSGGLAGSSKKICERCGGRGVIQNQRGFFMFQQDCTDCMGYGESHSSPCRRCNGRGRANKREKIRFSIPAGIADEAPVKISQKGEAGHGSNSTPGDLYVFVKILPHEVFTREGDDIRMSLSVPFWEAALGGNVSIQTLDDKNVSLKIPPCTQNGKMFRLSKKGMPSGQMFKSAGDLYVRVDVAIPHKLTREQEYLLKRIRDGAAGGS